MDNALCGPFNQGNLTGWVKSCCINGVQHGAEGCRLPTSYLVVHAKQGWNRGAYIAERVLAVDLVHDGLHLEQVIAEGALVVAGNLCRHLCRSTS